MPIRNRIAEVHGEITAWRRDLHKHPELGFDLDRTAAFVTEKLRAFGCELPRREFLKQIVLDTAA